MRPLANLILITLLVLHFFPQGQPGPVPTGNGVLILEEDRRNRDTYDKGTLSILTSPAVKSWCDDNNLPFQALSLDDDPIHLDDQWPEMIAQGRTYGNENGYPVLVVIAKRAFIKRLPNSIDATLSLLKDAN